MENATRRTEGLIENFKRNLEEAVKADQRREEFKDLVAKQHDIHQHEKTREELAELKITVETLKNTIQAHDKTIEGLRKDNAMLLNQSERSTYDYNRDGSPTPTSPSSVTYSMMSAGKKASSDVQAKNIATKARTRLTFSNKYNDDLNNKTALDATLTQ